jgi:FtsH-binding integral membrane protein
MADRDYTVQARPVDAVRERNLLRNVYLWMTGGLLLTAVIALGVTSNTDILRALVLTRGVFFGLIIAELVLVFVLSARVMKMSPGAAVAAFAGYAALNGVTLSVVLLAYTDASLAQALFITAGCFLGMSIFAVTTKADLTRWGSYLFFGLLGVLIASVVNWFLKSAVVDWIVSYVGVAVFLGLTAYDTQVIRKWAQAGGDKATEADYIRLSILGALKLYLDFVNLFLFFLRIFGRRR